MNWFNNLKLSAKLFVSFFIITIIAALIGVTGIINLKNIDDDDTHLYQENVMGILNISNIQRAYLETNSDMINLFISDNNSKEEIYNSELNNLKKMEEYLPNMKKR